MLTPDGLLLVTRRNLLVSLDHRKATAVLRALAALNYSAGARTTIISQEAAILDTRTDSLLVSSNEFVPASYVSLKLGNFQLVPGGGVSPLPW